MIFRFTSASALCLLTLAAAFAEPTVILNVGDSITQGIVERCDYSKALNAELKYNDFVVINVGNSGKTLSSQVAADYRKTAQYQVALKLPANIVTIMLGTNDSKIGSPDPARNIWAKIKPTFADDARELAQTFRSMPSHPEVWILTPPPASDDNHFYINGTVIHDEEIPIFMKVAKENAYPVIDIWHTELLDHIGDGKADPTTSGTLANDYYIDGVHPTRKGNVIIGKKIASMLKHEKPKVEIAGEQLTCSLEGAEYQWYRDGKPVAGNAGGDKRGLDKPGSGDYQVGVRLTAEGYDTLVSEPLNVP